MNTVRCGLYLRVSTDRQAQVKEGSLDTQEQALKNHIDYENAKSKVTGKMYEIMSIYREEGKSGKNTNRPEFQKMMNDVKNGHLDMVLCTKMDRITRSLMDFYKMQEVFLNEKVDFYSMYDKFDTSNSIGRAVLKITLVFAELEREQTSERTKATMEHRATEGLWSGGRPPLGYDIDIHNKGVLVINSDEAKLVNIIYELYKEYASYRKVAQVLNEKGYRGKTWTTKEGRCIGGARFTTTSIQTILTNQVYLGNIDYDGEIFEGKHKKIINKTLFDSVQKIRKENYDSNRSIKVSGKYDFLLKRLVVCANCESMMTTTHTKKKDKRHFYYICSNRNHNGKCGCDKKMVNAEALDNFVVNEILNLRSNKKLKAKLMKDTNNSRSNELKSLLSEKKALQNRINDISRKREMIISKLSSDMLDMGIIKEEIEQLENNAKQVQQEMNMINEKIEQARENNLDREAFEYNLSQFNDYFEELDNDKKREALQYLVKSVVVSDERIIVIFYGSNGKLRIISPKSVNHLFELRSDKLPGDNPLRNSKTSVLTENPQKSTSEISREYPSNVPETTPKFNRLRNSGPESCSTMVDVRRPTPNAPESDVSAFNATRKGECVQGQKKTPPPRTCNT